MDFQNTDDERRLLLNTPGTRTDLRRHGIELEEGVELVLYSDDADDDGRPDPLLVKGHVRFNSAKGEWVAEINWSAIRNESDLRQGRDMTRHTWLLLAFSKSGDGELVKWTALPGLDDSTVRKLWPDADEHTLYADALDVDESRGAAISQFASEPIELDKFDYELECSPPRWKKPSTT